MIALMNISKNLSTKVPFTSNSRMARAVEVLTGEAITELDDRADYGEDRWITVGRLGGRLVVLVWTKRGTKYRIISMRKANDREQKIFTSILDRSR